MVASMEVHEKWQLQQELGTECMAGVMCDG